MKVGKKVVAGIMVFSILISISFVSAGLKDWFVFGESSDLEGELDASFNLGIQMTNQAPFITSWTVPTASPNGDCTPTTLGNFLVTVTDPDGGADLSDGVVTLRLSNTHATLGAQFRPTIAVTCSAGAPAGNTVVFTCLGAGISMNYWDDGSAADYWTVTVTATDGSNAATNSPRISTAIGGSYSHFVYGSLKQAQIKDNNDADYITGDDTISWTGIQTTSADSASTIYLTARTCGNEAILITSVTGKRLDSTTATDICPNSFSVRAAASPCNIGDVLNWPATPKAIALSTLAVSTGTEVNKPFYFCIEDINPIPSVPDTCLDPIQVGTYSSSGNPWDIEFN